MKIIYLFVIASGEIEIRRLRLKHYYKAQLTFGCENPFKMIEQHFEYIAVVDFEATCDHNQGNNYPHEIIEFPIVLINVQQQMIVSNRLKKILGVYFVFVLGGSISIILSTNH